MKRKRCFRCGSTQPLANFYRHPRMADGHLNKCRECTRRDVQKNYAARREHYHAYERARAQDPVRKKAVAVFSRLLRKRNPDKAKAWCAVHNALRAGQLVRRPCEVCGTSVRVQAHHEDYSKPLDVRWLCFKHHRETAHGQVVTHEAAE